MGSHATMRRKMSKKLCENCGSKQACYGIKEQGLVGQSDTLLVVQSVPCANLNARTDLFLLKTESPLVRDLREDCGGGI